MNYSIYAESTPNPEVMKFVSNRMLADKSIEIKNVGEAYGISIAIELLKFPFVESIYMSSNFISITKNKNLEWESIAMQLRIFITDHLNSNEITNHTEDIKNVEENTINNKQFANSRVLTQKEKDEKRALEKEILNHAISASILKESASSLTKSQKDEAEIKETEVLKKPTPEEPKIELDNSMGVLDWLNSSLVKETVHSNTSTSTPVVQKSQLIEKFIKGGEEKIHLTKEVTPTLLQIERPQTEFFSPENMAKMSLAENEDFVTETLAKIYAQQGNIKKAISAYEKLSLKIPEKSNYFARLIQELKEN